MYRLKSYEIFKLEKKNGDFFVFFIWRLFGLLVFFENRSYRIVQSSSGGELLEMRLLDSHLLDTFGSKSIARHKFYQLLESS